MREQIIRITIEYLKKDGLKFSIDSIAKELKISKKTIYKIFKTKESLAISVYEKYFDSLINKVVCLPKQCISNYYEEMISLYFESMWMTRDDIFNKYQLNNAIYNYVKERNNEFWEFISSLFPNNLDVESLRLIVDGTFREIIKEGRDIDSVISLLVKLL